MEGTAGSVSDLGRGYRAPGHTQYVPVYSKRGFFGSAAVIRVSTLIYS